MAKVPEIVPAVYRVKYMQGGKWVDHRVGRDNTVASYADRGHAEKVARNLLDACQDITRVCVRAEVTVLDLQR